MVIRHNPTTTPPGTVVHNSSWMENTSALTIEQLFDLKRNELESKPDQDCFCPNGRNNWIHYSHCPGRGGRNHGAGIKDRQNILRNVMWYADELCAKIALECTPKVWLSEAHGCYAPPEARWDVYFTPVRKTSNGVVLTAKNILHWDIDAETAFKGLVEIKGDTTNVRGYEMGRKLYAEGTPFVWQFDVTFWQTNLYTPKNIWPNQLLSHRKYSVETCGVVDFDASIELLNIGQLVLQELKIQRSNDFVTIHLRRGDHMGCDTKVETVIDYLKCSIGEDDIRKVLVLTNGKKEYLRQLREGFSKAFPAMEMISLDDFIESESFIEKLNQGNLLSSHDGDAFLHDNCFRFATEKVLVSMARYHLERGHIYCNKNKCDRGGVNVSGPII